MTCNACFDFDLSKLFIVILCENFLCINDMSYSWIYDVCAIVSYWPIHVFSYSDHSVVVSHMKCNGSLNRRATRFRPHERTQIVALTYN